MKPTMLINNAPVPIGDMDVHFQYVDNNGPPYALLDIHSDSEDSSLGGVAINCLNVKGLSALSGMFGRTLTFGRADEAEGNELGESVFWKPGDETLELSSLELRFGQPQEGLVLIELAAICFDLEGEQGIRVFVSGLVAIPTERPKG